MRLLFPAILLINLLPLAVSAQIPDVIFAEGFETGDVSRWSPSEGERLWRVLPIRSEDEFLLGKPGGEAEQHPHSIARSAANPGVIYLSHDVAGTWRSNNGGESWQKALDRGLFVRAGQSIEVDPVNPSIVLFEADNSYDWLAAGFEGLFRSTNGGDDWELVRICVRSLDVQGA